MKNIELNELIDLIEKTEVKKEVHLNSVEVFIRNKNITSGLDYVPTYIIYYEYCKHIKDPYGKTHFFRLFSRYFDLARIGKQRRYLLDKNKFDMSREEMLKAKRFNDLLKKKK